VSTDASNMKNRKLFAICIQHFSAELGINQKLLDFVELNDEHPTEVADMLITSITSHGLDVKNVSAYSADNASVNYGCKKSVYTELKKINADIVKANCNAHIIHNTLRNIAHMLDCDVETIVMSI